MSTIPLAEARAQLSRIVDDAVSTHERVEITRNGSRAAVLLGADDYDGLLETLDVLAGAETVADIQASLAEFQQGPGASLGEVRAEMQARGRLAK